MALLTFTSLFAPCILLFQANSSPCLTFYSVPIFACYLLFAWNVLSIISTCSHSNCCSGSLSDANSSLKTPLSFLLGVTYLSLGCWWHFIQCKAVVPCCLLLRIYLRIRFWLPEDRDLVLFLFWFSLGPSPELRYALKEWTGLEEVGRGKIGELRENWVLAASSIL